MIAETNNKPNVEKSAPGPFWGAIFGGDWRNVTWRNSETRNRRNAHANRYSIIIGLNYTHSIQTPTHLCPSYSRSLSRWQAAGRGMHASQY